MSLLKLEKAFCQSLSPLQITKSPMQGLDILDNTTELTVIVTCLVLRSRVSGVGGLWQLSGCQPRLRYCQDRALLRSDGGDPGPEHRPHLWVSH